MYNITFQLHLTKALTAAMHKKIMDILVGLHSKFAQGFKYKQRKNKQSLTIDISSDGFTATDLLVQFDKQVRQMLGKEFKAGIKDITIKTYTITETLEEAPKKKVTIPLAHKITFKNKTMTLAYENVSFEWVKEHYMEKSLKLLKDKIRMLHYEGKEEFRKYIWKGKERKVTYKGDPAVDLEKQGWIKRTEGKGQFVYGREFTALMNVMKELLVEHIYQPLGFYEMTFPKFEPWSIPKKSGHAENIYPNAYFITVPKNASPAYWQEVMDLYAITGDVQTEQILAKSTCVGMMSYAQCPPFWPYLQGKVIDEKTLPLLVYDWSGPTYRNESGGTHGLDRIEEFHRVETLYVGTKDQAVKMWESLKEAFIKFYDQVLDTEIKVARVTPWWMAHAGIKTKGEHPDVGTYDFDAYLPYRGDRKKEWLEIQNVSSNGDKYPKAFRVKTKAGEFLWSGCCGASLQRIIVAFLAQKGLDPKNWPATVRKRFAEKTKGIKQLKFY